MIPTLNYKFKRYWYHVSNRLDEQISPFIFTPPPEHFAVNRAPEEPRGKRICVAPSIEQCFTALQQSYATFQIYRTKKEIRATKPVGIFDVEVTHEGWILKPTWFVNVGSIAMSDIDFKHIEDVACGGDAADSYKALNNWRKLELWKYVTLK